MSLNKFVCVYCEKVNNDFKKIHLTYNIRKKFKCKIYYLGFDGLKISKEDEKLSGQRFGLNWYPFSKLPSLYRQINLLTALDCPTEFIVLLSGKMTPNSWMNTVVKGTEKSLAVISQLTFIFFRTGVANEKRVNFHCCC